MQELREIKGVGYKNEYYLNGVGITHIDGLTAFIGREISLRSMIISMFPARVAPSLESLQNWVQQALCLVNTKKRI